MIPESFLSLCIAAALAKKGDTLPLPPTTDFWSLSTSSASTTNTSPSEVACSQRAPLSKEAEFYYAGLPPSPPLVGRSSATPWQAPSGMEEHTRPKVLGTVGKHEIKNLWEGGLSLQIVNYLNSKKVPWTSVDVVRISYVGESFRPVILWIRVLPESLSAEDGTHLARSCIGHHRCGCRNPRVSRDPVARSETPRALLFI